MTDKILVLSTCASTDEAARIARDLVEKRLAACVNLLPGLRSIYHWQGAVEDSGEVLLLIKSRRDLLPDVTRAIASLHSYTVPEVIAVPVVDGASPYLNWMDKELQPAS
jgi:periplasmic divalent cation tolerance protein